ncbi:STAS domain-containing protein [Streptomyces sp. 4.24]|uniref:STAS domain-containing protein n=1 Tax=Streptomyces tritrimontium TaxID=3406573 RepID=UPI003BB6356D
MTGAGEAHQRGTVGEGRRAGAGWVVSAHGELDQDTLSPLEAALDTAAGQYPLVVLDVGEVTFGDSSFLNLLLRTHRVTELRIAAPGEQLRRLFALTGADTVLSLHASVGDALGE